MDKLEKILLFVLAVLFALTLWIQLQNARISHDTFERLDRLDAQIEKLCEEQAETWQQIEKVKKLQREAEDRMDKLFGFTATVTAYAPLDPGAVEGMCYSGDRNITASGARVTPGVTVAAGPELAFGTRIWIEGVGLRVVHDRGERIGNRDIDLAVATREEALAWGRRMVTVVIEK